jgi:5-methylcytosine-specific restriction endonuclease McrA
MKDSPDKFHLNLYGIDSNGREVMLTKDHIIPRSKGGKNKLSNYQPMCIHCNKKKADK